MTWTFTEPEAGDVIAERYELEKVLGRGGFGIVFKANDLQTQRTVALKVLHATYARKDSKAVERFRREAILSASIGYPNSVRVFDYGETDDGIFFLVMEYLEGATLSVILRERGPLSEALALHITRQILQSAMEAHSNGIVHRDFKPENVMVVPLQYDPYFVKVMDFGIAKMAISTGPQITQAGQTFGTPRYMAPEQLQGGQLSPATDLYAVGLILYEMLTGVPAIQTESLAETISEVIMGAPVELPENILASDLCRDLLAKACVKAPRERFQSAEDFLADLDKVVGHTPGDFSTPPQQTPHLPGRLDASSAETLALDTSLPQGTEVISRAAETERVYSPSPETGPDLEGSSMFLRLGCAAAGVLMALVVVVGIAALLYFARDAG